MRSFASGILGTIAVVSAMLASWNAWFARHVVDRAGFEQLTAPLINDPDISQGLMERTTQETGTAITEKIPFLGAIRGGIDQLLQNAAPQIANTDLYRASSREALLSLHDSAFGPGYSAALDLGPIATPLAEKAAGMFGLAAPSLPSMKIPLGTPSIAGINIFEAISKNAELWPLFLAVAVGAALLCVLVAVRRARALVVMGMWCALAGGAGWLLIGLMPTMFASMIPDALGAQIVRKIAQTAVLSAREEVLWLVYAGAAAVVAGIGVGLLAKERKNPYVSH